MSSSATDFHNQLIRNKGIDNATGFSAESQKKRFEVFYERCLDSGSVYDADHVLDYGCGVGGFLHYMTFRGWEPHYTGVDINPRFLKKIRSERGSVATIQGCITEDRTWALLSRRTQFDYTFSSGAFCYADQQHKHMKMLMRLWLRTGKMMAVNFLNNALPGTSEARKPLHCLYDTTFAITLANALDCKAYAVYADYLPNDFTVALYKTHRKQMSPC
jgi:SAM-dependent methyltransferase